MISLLCYFKNIVDRILHPSPMASSSQEQKDTISRFWLILQNNYESNKA